MNLTSRYGNKDRIFIFRFGYPIPSEKFQFKKLRLLIKKSSNEVTTDWGKSMVVVKRILGQRVEIQFVSASLAYG